jgi:hypothetical protein
VHPVQQKFVGGGNFNELILRSAIARTHIWMELSRQTAVSDFNIAQRST